MKNPNIHLKATLQILQSTQEVADVLDTPDQKSALFSQALTETRAFRLVGNSCLVSTTKVFANRAEKSESRQLEQFSSVSFYGTLDGYNYLYDPQSHLDCLTLNFANPEVLRNRAAMSDSKNHPLFQVPVMALEKCLVVGLV